MATVRTQLLPRCCCTSQMMESPFSRSTVTALKIDGSLPAGNSMSMTGPVMAMTLPTAPFVVFLSGAAMAMWWVLLERGAGSPARWGSGSGWLGGGRSGVRAAFAPVAISIISRVMLAWRTLLYVSVRSSMSSSAFSVAFFIATMRADCSLAVSSRTAWKRRVAT